MDHRSRKTILLVEDDPLAALAETAALEGQGYRVVPAVSGEDAVRQAATMPEIDLVLMDLVLGPGMDGATAAREILARRNLPVVFLSSHTEAPALARIEGIASCGYVVKHAGEGVLFHTLRTAFRIFEERQKDRERDAALQTVWKTSDDIVQAIPSGLFIYRFAPPDRLVLLSCNPAAERLSGRTIADCRGQEFNDLWPEALRLGITSRCLDTLRTGTPCELEDVASPDPRISGNFRIRAFPLPEERLAVAFEKTSAQKQGDQIRTFLARSSGAVPGEDFFATLVRRLAETLDAAFVAVTRLESADESLHTVAAWCDGAPGGPRVLPLTGTPCGVALGQQLCCFPQAVQERFPSSAFLRDLEAESYVGTTLRDHLGHPLGVLAVVGRHPLGCRSLAEALLPIVGARAGAELERLATEEALRDQREGFRALSSMLRLMCDNVPDMIWAKDLEKRYLFVNRALCEGLLGARDTDEPLGKNDLFFARREREAHPEDPRWHTFGEICQDSDALTLAAGRPCRFDEFGNVRGKFLFLDVHKAPFVDAQGTVLGVVGSARDVTVQKETERLLQESEAQYRLLLDHSSDLIWNMTAEGIFTYISPSWKRVLGYDPHTLVGTSFEPLVHPEDLPLCRQYLADMQDRQDPAPTPEYRVQSADGTWQWHVTHGMPVRNAQGKFLSLVGVTRDITERRKDREILKRTLEEKELLLHELQHRVKNSFASVLGLLHLEAQGTAAPHAREVLQDAEGRIRVMMLLYEKLSRAANPLAVDLKAYLLELATHLLDGYTSKDRITLSSEFESLCLPAREATAVGLIVNELMTNALKHAFPAGGSGTIRLVLKRDADRVLLTVTDDGPGMPPSGGPSSRSLGLRIVELAVQQLGGHMAFRNTPGLEVTVTFPVP